eukprot:635475-Prymnesium_polylepis.1
MNENEAVNANANGNGALRSTRSLFAARCRAVCLAIALGPRVLMAPDGLVAGCGRGGGGESMRLRLRMLMRIRMRLRCCNSPNSLP